METNSRLDSGTELLKIPNEIAGHIADLTAKKDYRKKMIAKQALIYMGKTVLPEINSLLCSENHELRLLAVKIIQQIKSEESIDTLIRLLSDDESSIRWIAAKGLILVGRPSIVPLLKAITQKNKSFYLKWGAHYVLMKLLNDSEKEEFKTLLISLSNNHYTSLLAPIEASKALKIFKCLNYNN